MQYRLYTYLNDIQTVVRDFSSQTDDEALQLAAETYPGEHRAGAIHKLFRVLQEGNEI